MYKQSTAHRHEQANPSTLTIEQTQAITVVTNKDSTSPSPPRNPSLSNNATKSIFSLFLSTSANTSTELLATGTARASYIAAPSQPRTEVQMELSFSRKFRQLERERKQRRDKDRKPSMPATQESESSSAFASSKGVHWAGLPEEIAELTVGTREALRRVVREGRCRRVVCR